MSAGAGPELFDTQIDSWRAWQQSPWGRIRYRVVAETLRRTCADLGPGPLRIVDVGGGDGGDAVPLAEAGHAVTIVDQSTALLTEARAAAGERGVGERLTTVHAALADIERLDLGTFDLVLCHNVLQYLPATDAAIRSLVGLVDRRGAVSVMATNPPSDLLTAAIRRHDLDEARRMLTAGTARACTFDHDIRRVASAEVEAAFAEVGMATVARYGIRVITDYITDDARKHEQDFYRQLEQLELDLCDQEPYLHMARSWQVIGATR